MVLNLSREARETKEAFIAEVKNRGGLCIPLTGLFESAYPDMLVMLSGGVMAFAEFNNSREDRLQANKEKFVRQLIELGVSCYCVAPDADWHMTLDVMTAEAKRKNTNQKSAAKKKSK